MSSFDFSCQAIGLVHIDRNYNAKQYGIAYLLFALHCGVIVVAEIVLDQKIVFQTAAFCVNCPSISHVLSQILYLSLRNSCVDDD